MRLDDLTRHKHRNKLGVAIVVIAILGVVYFGGLGMQSAFDASDINIYNSAGGSVNDGDTILEADGLYLEAIDIQIDNTFQCNLYLAADGSLISEGVEASSANDYIWTFDLSDVYKGINTYNLMTVENDPWISYSFNIIGDDNSPILDLMDLPELTFSQPDESVMIGDVIELTWAVEYEASAVVEFYLNGILVETATHIGSVGAVEYKYSFSSGIVGVFEVEFKFIPDSALVSEITDVAIITVSTDTTTDTDTTTTDTTTTDTTTTDTTTDTDTTTTGAIPPVEPGIDYMLLAIGAAAVVIVGFVMLKKRSEY